MKIAAVNWKLRDISREEEFYDHLGEILDQCSGCDIAVLPELFQIELLSVHRADRDSDIPKTLAPHFNRIVMQAGSFAGFNEISFLASGTQIMSAGSGFLNACMMHADNTAVTQEKLVLTEWEREIGISGGSGLTYHSSSRVGVTICLDAEFPASGRALAEAGMLFQCVPAWTETMHGFHRVRTACRARAVENQVCVIHSSLVGQVGNEKCVGSSAIIVPPHEPFPEDPILAETPMNEEGIAFAEVDPEDLLRCREMGEVRNWRDRDAGDWTVHTV